MDKDHWINKDNLWHDYHTMDYLCHNNHYLYKKYPSIGNLACISLKPLKSQNKYIYYTKEPYFQTVPKIKEAKISHRKINGSFFMTPMPSPLNNFSFPTFVFCTTQLLFVDCTLLQQVCYALGEGLIDAQPLLMSLARISSETRSFFVKMHFMRKSKFLWIWCITDIVERPSK